MLRSGLRNWLLSVARYRLRFSGLDALKVCFVSGQKSEDSAGRESNGNGISTVYGKLTDLYTTVGVRHFPFGFLKLLHCTHLEMALFQCVVEDIYGGAED